MTRLNVSEVQITLENGKVLHFIASAGDRITINHVLTSPTGTPASAPRLIEYYSLTCQSGSTVVKGQKDQV